ncbi:MAG: HNH endonuclease [Acidobacteriota bacterium]
MNIMLDASVLVLNRVYLPIRVTTVRMALGLIYQGRAVAILPDYSTYDFDAWLARKPDARPSLGIVGGRLGVPRVIVLSAYDGVPRHEVRFTRRNVYARDGHRCQYCSATPGSEELNLDHVHPTSRGGPSSWENVVTCCVRCNRRKADRRPEDVGMSLLRKPKKPRWHPLHEVVRDGRERPAEWRHFVDESLFGKSA